MSDNGPNQPVGRFAPVHNNTNNARFTNNNAQSAHGHPGEGRRSFHSNNPQAMPRSPAKPKPPLAKAGEFHWVTLRARWVMLRARWVTLRARWVTLRTRWVTRRARWVTLRDR